MKSSKAKEKPPSFRPKRHQVAQACNWCRLNRIKCDEELPCRNCRNRGNECSNNRDKQLLKSLPLANQEIEKLRAKVSELETQLHQQSDSSGKERKSSISVSPSSVPHHQLSTRGPLVPPVSSAQASQSEYTNSMVSAAGEGQYTLKNSAEETIPYGTFSITSFVERMQTHLSNILRTPLSLNESCQPNSSAEPSVYSSTEVDLTRAQENHLLDLFWQSYHCFTPIVNMPEFRAYHDSLWLNPTYSAYGTARRQPSPLVDIMLALCLQYGSASALDQASALGVHPAESYTRGRSLYHRCQNLLEILPEVEPISALQCHLYSIAYLLHTGEYDVAHQTLAKTVEVAKAIGLHQDPAKSLPRPCRYLRRRLWWTLFIWDTRFNLTIDQPFLTSNCNPTVAIPANDIEEAYQLGAGEFSTYPGISYLACHTQCIRLAIEVRATFLALRFSWAKVSIGSSRGSMYSDITRLENCASSLLPHIKRLHSWPEGVPEALKSPRQGGATPLSTSKTRLEHDFYIPFWLQRQRIYLEILFHGFMASLLHPFIRFSTSTASGIRNHAGPTANGYAVMALEHARATTNVLSQLLSETDLLHGWHASFRFQWEAAITIFGFIVAYPGCAYTIPARKTLDASIDNIDTIAKQGSTAARSMRDRTRKWNVIINYLIHMFYGGTLPPSNFSTAPSNHFDMSAFGSPPGTSPPYLLQNAAQTAWLAHVGGQQTAASTIRSTGSLSQSEFEQQVKAALSKLDPDEHPVKFLKTVQASTTPVPRDVQSASHFIFNNDNFTLTTSPFIPAGTDDVALLLGEDSPIDPSWMIA